MKERQHTLAVALFWAYLRENETELAWRWALEIQRFTFERSYRTAGVQDLMGVH